MSILHDGIPDTVPIFAVAQPSACAGAIVPHVPVDTIGALALNLRLAYLAIHIAEVAQLRGYYAIFQEFER